MNPEKKNLKITVTATLRKVEKLSGTDYYIETSVGGASISYLVPSHLEVQVIETFEDAQVTTIGELVAKGKLPA